MPDAWHDPWIAVAKLCAQALDVKEPTDDQLGMVKTTIVRTIQTALAPQTLESRKIVMLERIAAQLEAQTAIAIVRLQKDGASDDEIAALINNFEERAKG